MIRADAYHWRTVDGYYVCRVMVGGRWLYEAWPPRPAPRPTLDTLPRAFCRVVNIEDALRAVRLHRQAADQIRAGPSG